MDEQEIPKGNDAKKTMAPMLLSATGDFLVLIGVLFILLGASAFVTDFLDIEGAGEFLVGLFLVVIGYVLLMRSRRQMTIRMVQTKKMAQGMMQQPPPNDPDSGAYR